jgi:NAD(P)-dependent dehydrogenase (short-subunit alcohol dehydrogenase family)
MGVTATDRRVLVTGASRGIGLATAQRFVAEGARVALVARGEAQLKQVAEALGDRSVVVAGDTSDPADCRRIVTAATRQLGGPIDVLISNAGILRRDFVEDITVTDFEESYRTNAGGALWLAQAVMGPMRERGAGAIVLVCSELGLFGAPSYGTYCMSKFAMIGLAEVLSHELAGTGVRVTAICPGNVATDQFAEELAWGPAAGASAEKALSPESVADTILRATGGGALVVLADKPVMKLNLDILLALPRRARMAIIRDAYKAVLRDRRRQRGSGPA